MKSHINLKKINANLHSAETKKTIVQKLKDTSLLAYVILTVLAAYSGAIFYEGTQYASASTSTVHAHSSQTNPKAPSR